jgi:hypothetical protein
MKLSDIVSRVVIDPRKLTDYALNPDNPVGRHKALVFERYLGFTRDNYKSLLQQMETQVLDSEAHMQRTDPHGRHYHVDLEIMEQRGGRQLSVQDG